MSLLADDIIVYIEIPKELKKRKKGQPGWLSGLVPPSAQGVTLETRDRVPRRAPCMEPASLSASLPVSLMNK